MAKGNRWIMWIGGDSRILHVPSGGSTGTVTLCGLTAQLTGPYGVTLPAGTFTHCGRCRSLLGE